MDEMKSTIIRFKNSQDCDEQIKAFMKKEKPKWIKHTIQFAELVPVKSGLHAAGGQPMAEQYICLLIFFQ